MELKLFLLIATISFVASCAKSSVSESYGESHEIVVSIADTQIDTKCTVNIVDKLGIVSFSPGDELILYDSQKRNAKYQYKSKRSGTEGDAYIFQKEIREELVDTLNISAACFPASNCFSYNVSKKGEKTLGVQFNQEQTYTESGGIQTISAPMVSLVQNDKKQLVFSNVSCLLKIGICCSEIPENDIIIDKINITSELNYLDGVYNFSSTNKVSTMYQEEDVISLVNCKSAGAISTDVKYFYITLPPLFEDNGYTDEDTLTVDVILVGGKSVSKTFTATKGEVNNQITKNTILDFTDKPEKLITINPSDLL